MFFKESWRESYRPNLGEMQKKQPGRIEYINIRRPRKKSVILVKKSESKKDSSIIQVKNFPDAIKSKMNNNIKIKSAIIENTEKSTIFQNIKVRNK